VALAALGADAQPIPAKEDRSPCWPQGYVGSISHSGSHCIAIAARARDFASLGADLETTTPLTAQLIPLVVHRGDRLGGGAEAVGAKRAFVAKEAYYKALYPLRGQLLDFLDVAVDLGGSSGAFRASLRRDGGADLLGSFSVLAGHYLAIVVAAAAGDGAGAA
jgi:4'-phosphopantetheinyl transferase EntD